MSFPDDVVESVALLLVGAGCVVPVVAVDGGAEADAAGARPV